jgi:hypothetical protein
VSQDGWRWMPKDQPRHCGVCGEKVTLTGPESLWFATMTRETFHVYCRLSGPRAAA